jgi:cytochrome c-type biogenesis protein
MEALFTTLTHAIEGTPAIALAAAFAWGILSIVLSPCHLASIPLIVGFIDDQGRVSTRHTFLISVLFAVGILITIGLIGVITVLAGRMMGDLGRYANYLVAVVFFVAGLYLLDAIPISLSGLDQVNMKRKGMWAAFILGLVFGIALGPCTFAYMAPMLGVTFNLSATKRTIRGIAPPYVWNRTLHGPCRGGDVHRARSRVSELDQRIERSHRSQVDLWHFGVNGRIVHGMWTSLIKW